MLRFIVLYFVFIWYKIKYLGKVRFVGYSVCVATKGSSISIGEGTGIGSGSLRNLLGLYQRTIIVARYGGKITIGKNVGISGSTIYAMKEIVIGNNCQIGANCKIIDNDFHSLNVDDNYSTSNDSIIKKAVRIGDNCFIGMNSILLKGTELGSNVIVGAGSVVCGVFPDNVIIVGNPAKIVKYRSLN